MAIMNVDVFPGLQVDAAIRRIHPPPIRNVSRSIESRRDWHKDTYALSVENTCKPKPTIAALQMRIANCAHEDPSDEKTTACGGGVQNWRSSSLAPEFRALVPWRLRRG